MNSTELQGWIAQTGALSRLASGFWLLAVLLVLHGAVQTSHSSSSQQFIPATGTMGGLGASERADIPSLQPRASFGSILTEARSLVPGRELSPDRDPPSALLPVLAPLDVPTTVKQPRAGSREQPRPKARRAFEARAPPSTA